MRTSLTDLLYWVTNEWSDPNWPFKLLFWTLLGGAAWLLLRSGASRSRYR